MKKLLLILIILPGLLFSEKNSDFSSYRLFGNLESGYNIYSSSFKNLPGVNNCCTDFNNAADINFGLNLGLQKALKNTMFFDRILLEGSLFYSNLSATYKEPYEIGNVITGNSYVKGISEFTLDISLHEVGLEPAVNLFPVKNLPISIKIGLKAGLLLKKTFNQYETLLEPSNALFENFSKTRNEKNGEIPNSTSFLTAINAGVNYEITKIKNFLFIPHINYTYYLNPIISGYDWNISSVNIGLMIAYRIPKKKVIPPVKAPDPVFPEIQKPAEFALDLKVFNKDKQINNGDTISFKYEETRYQRVHPLLPLVYFKENSDEFLSSGEENLSPISAQDYSIRRIAGYMKDNDSVMLRIELFSAGEDSRINEFRKIKLYNSFNYLGITADRITEINVNDFNDQKFKHPELLAENRKAVFILSDNKEMFNLITDSLSIINSEQLNFNIEAETKTELKLVKIDGSIYYNSERIFNFNESKKVYSLKDDNPVSIHTSPVNRLEIKTLVSDALNNRKEASVRFFVKADSSVVNVLDNFSRNEDSSIVMQYILCWFDFDKSEIEFYNKYALDKIRDYMDKGAKIEIIPLTDSLGTEQHNINLARKRAKAAEELINSGASDLSIVYPETYYFDNNTVLGRIYNRSVLVRIISKK